MAHFKIIQTGGEHPDVLLFRDIDDDNNNCVKILAVGTIDGESNMFAEETIVVESWETAISFIGDFSVDSANKWCERQKISYWDTSA